MTTTEISSDMPGGLAADVISRLRFCTKKMPYNSTGLTKKRVISTIRNIIRNSNRGVIDTFEFLTAEQTAKDEELVLLCTYYKSNEEL